MKASFSRLAEQLKPVYNTLNRLSGGSLEFIRCAIDSFQEARSGDAAASIAYFTLFSLFPLLTFLIAGASLFLERSTIRQQLFYYISLILPVSQKFILETIEAVLAGRGAISLISLAGLLWAALSVFSNLALNINRAWSEAQVRNFLASRLVALGMVAALMVLLFVSLLATTVINLLVNVQLPLGGSIHIYGTFLFGLVAMLLPFLIRLGLLYGLYRWVPTIDVRGAASFWGALAAAVLWEIITRAFAFYLASGWARYDQVYGSLGTIIALMFYVYLGSQSVLFGAHLTAAISAPGKLNHYRIKKAQPL